MCRSRATIATAAALAIAGANLAPATASAATAPAWRTLARCAAAYQANARMADPGRPSSMVAMVAEQGADYEEAAVRGFMIARKAARTVAQEAVRAYVEVAERRFAGQPRATVEKVIEACPQP